MSLLREHFGRQHLLAKSFKGPSPVMPRSGSTAVQGYESTTDWLNPEDHRSPEHPVTAVPASPDKCQVPTKDCPCPKSSSAVF